MNNKVSFNQNQRAGPDEILKVTSLLYLKDALINEKYEECPGLIRAAKKFGARHRDVRSVIARYICGMNALRPFGIVKRTKGAGGRLRF